MAPEPSVLHLLWDGGMGGIQRVVEDLAREQVGTGRTVGVGLGQAVGPFAQRFAATGATVIDLGLRSGYDLRPWSAWRSATRLSRFDVVHLHGFNVPLTLVALLARRPIVYTEHANFAAGRRLRPADRAKRRLLRSFLERRVAAVTAISRFAEGRMRELYGLESTGIEVIPNGIDLRRFPVPASDRATGTSPLRVLCLGRLAGFKRVDRLLEAAARLEPGVAVVRVVGEGPCAPALRRRAAHLGLGPEVRFEGASDDVAELLHEADVLVHPAQGEGFGVVLLEACACGVLPVVFRDGGGALEAVPPDAIIVDDPGDCARALADLPRTDLLSPARRQQRARWAREHFALASMARSYELVYRRVAA